MGGVQWWQLSSADAEAFRDHVVRRTEARLIDLARQMKSSGGPIDLMDGTPASLTPIWEWYVRMVDEGLPGTREDAVPSSTRFLGYDDSPSELNRAGYVAESLEHYLFLVADSLSKDARWEVSPGRASGAIIDDETNRTGIVSSGFRFLSAQELLSRLALRAVQRKPVVREPRLLENFFRDQSTLPAEVSRPLNRLRELANEPEVAWDDPVRQPPTRSEPPIPAPQTEGPRGFALIVTSIGSPAEAELQAMKPISERDVARFLGRLGFREGDIVLTPEALSDGDLQLTDRDTSVVVDSFHADGRLRMLSVEPHGGDEAAWSKLERQLRKFAGRHALTIREETS
ncbi:MAG TPA: hypothetical protein VN108_00145 [Marmoricola sp.]|nr:hypothetical protein [Marmoricola sp.]